LQSQGTQREPPKSHTSTEKEQLQLSAEMFEMILRTAPDDIQNYFALKEVYRKLDRVADFKRVVKRLAEFYLASDQREKAAGEYADILELDPTDEEAAKSLQETGYTQEDLPVLNVEEKLKEVRRKHEEKLRELREAEEALLKADARAGEAGKGRDEERRRSIQAIEEETEKKTQELVEEHDRWLSEGRAEVFAQVAHSLKQEADGIIETNQYGDINKSVKEAKKILASTDKVFQEEWHRVRSEREKEFRERFDDLKRKKEERLDFVRQEVVGHGEHDQAVTGNGLGEIKEELRGLERELREKEGQLRRSKKLDHRERSGEARPKDVASSAGMAGVPPDALAGSDKRPEETIPEPAGRRLDRDEVGKALGAILIQHGLVSPQHLEEAIAEQKKNHRPVGQILVESGYAAEEDIINALVAQAGVPYLPLANYEISDDVVSAVPKELALEYALMPVDKIASTLLVTMGIPLTKEQKHEIQKHVWGLKITYFISSWPDIKAKHETYYR